MTTLQFWFDYASTYAYLSAMRIDALAAERGVSIDWRPFLLGAIFKAQGWETSPFNVYPAKGRHMVRDIERIAGARGLPFQIPHADEFPRQSLLAARVGVIARREGWIADYSRAVFRAEFGPERIDIGDRAALRTIIATAGLNAAAVDGAGDDTVKDALRRLTDEAMALGIFGAPTFVAPDGEMFWGDDRLEHALNWTTGGHIGSV